MNNDELLAQILSELKRLNQNLKELTDYIKSVQKPTAKRTPKSKLPAPTELETKELQERFMNLFHKWLDGNETQVRLELEALSPEEIRRFGDANNLNVTSKMSKDKVLQLISIRFREKKLLTQNINVARPFHEQPNKSEPPTGEQ
jgi:hypothetical protein